MRIISKPEENKWALPENMAICANEFSQEYIPNSDIKENIFKEHLISSNVNTGKEVDDLYCIYYAAPTHVYP